MPTCGWLSLPFQKQALQVKFLSTLVSYLHEASVVHLKHAFVITLQLFGGGRQPHIIVLSERPPTAIHTCREHLRVVLSLRLLHTLPAKSIVNLSRLSFNLRPRSADTMAHTRPGTYVLYREAISEQSLYPAVVYTDDLAPIDIQRSKPPSAYVTLVLLISQPPELYRLYVPPCPHTIYTC